MPVAEWVTASELDSAFRTHVDCAAVDCVSAVDPVAVGVPEAATLGLLGVGLFAVLMAVVVEYSAIPRVCRPRPKAMEPPAVEVSFVEPRPPSTDASTCVATQDQEPRPSSAARRSSSSRNLAKRNSLDCPFTSDSIPAHRATATATSWETLCEVV